MTQRTPTHSHAGFADLRQQIAALVCNADVPADQIGTLPVSPLPPTKRGTLHLNPTAQKSNSKPSH